MGRTKALSSGTYKGYLGFNAGKNNEKVFKGLIKVIDEQVVNRDIIAVDVFNSGFAVKTSDPYNSGDGVITHPQPLKVSISINGATIVAGTTLSVNGRLYTAVSGAKADNTEFDISSANGATIAADIVDSFTNDTRPQTVGEVILGANQTNPVDFVQNDPDYYGVKGTVTPISVTGLGLSAGGASGGFFIGDDSDAYVDELFAVHSGVINNSALTIRRPIEIELDMTTVESTPNIMSGVLNLINNFEKNVAKSGNGATGDGTYSNVLVKGKTPWESQTWEITKSADYYYCEAQ